MGAKKFLNLKKKKKKKAASELERLASKLETSEVYDAKLAKSLVRDLMNCHALLRKDSSEDWIKYVADSF